MISKRPSIALAAALVLSLSALPIHPVAAGSRPPLAIAAGPSAPITALALGDSVYRPPSSAFAIAGDSDHLIAMVTPPPVEPGPEAEDIGPWMLQFRAPRGEPLVPGAYEDAEANDQTAGPLLQVRSTSLDYGGVKGRFVVHDYTRSEAGVVTSASVSFAQTFWSEMGDELGTVYGELRVNASDGFPWHSSPGHVEFGDTIVGRAASATVSIASTGTEPLRLHNVQLRSQDYDPNGDVIVYSGIEIVSDACSGRTVAPGDECTVILRGTPPRPGWILGRLDVSDNTAEGMASIGLSAQGVWPTSAVVWDAGRRVPLPRHAIPSLASSGTGSSGMLQLAYSTDPASGTPTVFAVRSSTGTTWSSPVRLSPAGQAARDATVAASGTTVYVAWLRPAGPDAATSALFLRANLHDGSGAWQPSRRLTALAGKVDRPAIAAAGTSVYVASTDLLGGSVNLAISADRGVTWRTTRIARLGATGASASPSVAAAGRLVVVAWATPDGAVKARLSTDLGRSWANVATLATADGSRPAVAATLDRAVVAWGSYVRSWRSGAWGPVQRAIAGRIERLDGIVINGSAGMAIAHSDYRDASWSESRDQGATWIGPSSYAPADGAREYLVNSITWPAPTVRYALVTFTESCCGDDAGWFVALHSGRGSP
jgi:hypothetical protein